MFHLKIFLKQPNIFYPEAKFEQHASNIAFLFSFHIIFLQHTKFNTFQFYIFSSIQIHKNNLYIFQTKNFTFFLKIYLNFCMRIIF